MGRHWGPLSVRSPAMPDTVIVFVAALGYVTNSVTTYPVGASPPVGPVQMTMICEPATKPSTGSVAVHDAPKRLLTWVGSPGRFGPVAAGMIVPVALRRSGVRPGGLPMVIVSVLRTEVGMGSGKTGTITNR